jgi:D-glycero-D-manno-heptose 1,7-bisphosphate phosphatase
MKRPAVFFDRDNTLIVTDGYLGNPAGVVLVEGAADAVARARALGYATVVFSNQSGVARGLFSEETVHAVNARLDELLHDQNRGAIIDRHEFCPFHPDATVESYRKESELRKPRPGMILQAAQRLALDLSRSWVIGDAPRDIEAGQAAGCRTILFRDPKLLSSPAARAESAVEPDYLADSLHAAMAIIEVQTRIERPEEAEEPAAATLMARAANASAGTAATAKPPVADPVDLSVVLDRLEALANQLMAEMRRGRELNHADFSVTKLLAGVVQIIALAIVAYGWATNFPNAVAVLLAALFCQTLTIALLIMGRQR